jgi:hypothetical protein
MIKMTSLLNVLLFSLISSALGRSLQEELGGTPEAPFGLTAGLIGVGGTATADVPQSSDSDASSGVMVAIIVVVFLLLLCCACLCCIGFFVFKRSRRNQREDIEEQNIMKNVGLPGGDGYVDSPTIASREID